MVKTELKIGLYSPMTYLNGSRRALKQNLPWPHMESLAPRILRAVTREQHCVDYLDLTTAKPDGKYDIIGVSYTTEHLTEFSWRDTNIEIFRFSKCVV